MELCKDLGESEKHKHKLRDESSVATSTGDKRPNDSSYFLDPKRQRIEKLRKVVNNPLLTDDEKKLLKRVIDEPEFEQFLRTHEKVGVKEGTNGIWANDEDASAVVTDDSVAENVDRRETAKDLAFLKEKIVKKVAANESRATKAQNCVKLTNLPPAASKSEIKTFLAPHKIMRIFRARKGAGFAYVQLENDAEVDKVISTKNRNILKGRQVKLVAVKQAVTDKQTELKNLEHLAKKPSRSDDEVEAVAESGRLFARNLSYACTEEELQAHFSQCGSVSQVHLPVDRNTRKSKGFALITYLFPENAVEAFNKFDGTIFQGRVLHLLPAKAKTPTTSEAKENSAFPSYQNSTTEPAESSEQNNNEFKTERDQELKQQAGISHNWNTLFLGSDVVAEAMTKRFNTNKRDIMGDDEEGSSAAVRIALGEAQMVQETKEFLVSHGVNINAFSSSVRNFSFRQCA